MVSYHRLLLSLVFILPMTVFAEDRNIWCYIHDGKASRKVDESPIILRDVEPRVRVKCDGRCITMIGIDKILATAYFSSTCYDDFKALGLDTGTFFPTGSLNGDGDDYAFISTETLDGYLFAGSCASNKCNDDTFITKILNHYNSNPKAETIRYHPPADYSDANSLNFSIINLAVGLLLTFLIIV